jgi:hypothetical protein
MKKLLSNGTILVGHSLHNDLRGKCHEHFVWPCLPVSVYMKGVNSVVFSFSGTQFIE